MSVIVERPGLPAGRRRGPCTGMSGRKAGGSAAPLVVIGGGGHGRVVAEAAEASGAYRVVAILDDKHRFLGRRNRRFLGPLSMIRGLLGASNAMKAVIAIGDNRSRRQVAKRLGLPPERYAVIIHNGAHISPSAVLAAGTVVMAGAVVNAGASVGEHSIVNSGAVVEHDAEVGPFAHLSPRAVLAGGVVVGEGAHIGVGASAIPSVRIGQWSILGAGGTAIGDIPDCAVAVGLPARIIRRIGEAGVPPEPNRQATGENRDDR